ncbi:MAG: DUF4352 domain-containing protein [Gaiellales bacterium]
MRGRLTVGASFCLLLAACGESEIKSEPDAEPETVTVTVTETVGAEPTTEETTTEEADTGDASGVARVGDAITLHGYDDSLEVRVELEKVLDPAPTEQYFGPSKGKRLVALKLRLVNTGSAIYDDSPSNGATLIDRRDQAYTSTLLPTPSCPDLGSPKIRAGDRRVGCITFEVPKGAKLRSFQFTLESGFGPETAEWELR